MTRKANTSKVASAIRRTEAAVSAAEDGKFEIGRVEKNLGNGSFIVRYGKGSADTCQVSICCNVLRGGKASDFHADRGDWVVYDGTEIQGIITSRTPDLFKRLKRAGRVPVLPDLESDGRAVDVYEEGGFTFEEAEDEDTEDDAVARETYLGGLEGARSRAEADAMVRAARVAASRANAYRNKRATREERVAAALREDPELAAQRELETQRRAKQSAADRARNARDARARAAAAPAGGAGPAEESEPETDGPLPLIDMDWEEAA